MEKRSLSEKEALDRGIINNHEQMPNGSYRFRLMASDGSGYIRTEGVNEGVWEGSHYHNATEELVAVQKGWLGYITFTDEGQKIEIIKEGEIKLLAKGVKHDTYLSANTIVHTVKFGHIVPNDRIVCPELDLITKDIDETELMKYM